MTYRTISLFFSGHSGRNRRASFKPFVQFSLRFSKVLCRKGKLWHRRVSCMSFVPFFLVFSKALCRKGKLWQECVFCLLPISSGDWSRE